MEVYIIKRKENQAIATPGQGWKDYADKALAKSIPHLGWIRSRRCRRCRKGHAAHV
jgi:hypothetical protein